MAEAAEPLKMSDLKNSPAPREVRLPVVTPGFGDLASFELMQRGAKVLAASSLVPKEYQGAEGLPNAIVALNMALRMQADPLMVMQNLYVVHGRPAWSAQFLIAAFNRCGRYSALRYEWSGARGKSDWGCRAWAIEKETGERVSGPLVTMATAEAEGWINRAGSKWKTIPELMLTYRAAAWMVRTNAPEIAMGLPTAEEREDMVTLTPEQYTVEQVKAGDHAAPATQSAPPSIPSTSPILPGRDEGSAGADQYLNPDQVIELGDMCKDNGIELKNLLKAHDATSLNLLPAEKYKAAKEWLAAAIEYKNKGAA